MNDCRRARERRPVNMSRGVLRHLNREFEKPGGAGRCRAPTSVLAGDTMMDRCASPLACFSRDPVNFNLGTGQRAIRRHPGREFGDKTIEHDLWLRHDGKRLRLAPSDEFINLTEWARMKRRCA